MWEWLIAHTAVAAALAGLALLAGRRTRLPPAALHLLWLVVLVKLLTPPVVAWPWAVPVPQSPARPTLPAPADDREELFTFRVGQRVDDPGQAEAPGSPSADTVTTSPDSTAPDAAAAPPTPWGERLGRAAVAVWVVGGVLLALVQATHIVRWGRRLSQGEPMPPWLAALVDETAAALGVRPPRAVVLSGLGSPMVWGFGPARLLWPAGLEDRLPPEGVRAVLTHELAHLRRRDHWVGWLLLAGGCVWWWHPLFAFARRRLGREAERACDAWVVALRPGGRRAYAEALLEVSQRPAAATAPALGAAGGRRDLEGRLVMIMRGDGVCRATRRWGLAAGALALLTAPAWTLGQQPDGAAKALPAQPKGSFDVPVEVGTQYFAEVFVASDGNAKNAEPTKPTDRDKKLAELETKLQALMKEMHDLRDGQPKPAGDVLYYGRTEPKRATNEYTRNQPVKTEAAVFRYSLASDGPGEVTLSRKTYTLVTGKADAVANFLKENVKAGVLETKSDGEKLVVTTTPEVQAAVGQLVALVNGQFWQGGPKANFTQWSTQPAKQ